MLQITLPVELWDEGKQEFVYQQGQTLEMEHSLASLSKWESKMNKPFLSKDSKTYEESLEYLKCMMLTPNVAEDIYDYLMRHKLSVIDDYINGSMTATILPKNWGGKKRGRPEIVTAEVIYYWMIAMQIPAEYEHWHLNKLITLIGVCNVKNSPNKKRSSDEILRDQMALNEERCKQLNTKG
jgi:hypothetical protein